MSRREIASGEIHLQTGRRSHFGRERRQVHGERIVRGKRGTGTVRWRHVRAMRCLPGAFPGCGSPEADMLKADVDRLAHPALPRAFLLRPSASMWPWLIVRVLGLQRTPEPLQLEDQGLALQSPILTVRVVAPSRRLNASRQPHGP